MFDHLMSFLFAVLAITALNLVLIIHEFGHYGVARAWRIPVQTFGLGFGPTVFCKRIGNVNFKINAFFVGAYVRFSDKDGKISLSEAPLIAQLSVLLAGVAMNFLTGFLLLLLLGVIGGTVVIGDGTGLSVNGVLSKSSAAIAGVRPGDVITRIGYDSSSLHRVTSPSVIENAVEEGHGKEVVLRVRRELQSMTYHLLPERSRSKGMLRYSLGVQIEHYDLRKYTFREAVRFASIAFVTDVEGNANLLLSLFGHTRSENLSHLSGPIGATASMAQSIQLGLPTMLAWVAHFALFIGVLNLFPFPKLDGWQVCVVMLKSCGVRVSQEVEVIVGLWAASVLATCVIMSCCSDVTKWFR